MDGNREKERRQSIRFPTHTRALFYLGGEKKNVEKCTIANVSYKGVGLTFPPGEQIKAGLSINIGIVVKWQFVPISVRGTVKWAEEGKDYCAAGAELNESMDNLNLMKLL